MGFLNLFFFSLRILERVLGWKHCKYKEWVSFFLGSWGMNRSAEQTNRPRTAKRWSGSRSICLFRATIHSPWTQKKRHSFLKYKVFIKYYNALEATKPEKEFYSKHLRSQCHWPLSLERSLIVHAKYEVKSCWEMVQGMRSPEALLPWDRLFIIDYLLRDGPGYKITWSPPSLG